MAKTRVEPFYEQLGARIYELRQRRGMSQERLGQLIAPKMTRASIANIEAGKQRVLAHTLWNIAKALGVGPAELVDGSDDTTPEKLASLREIETELAEKLPLNKANIRRLMSKMAERAGS